MAHKHVDLGAAARAVFKTKLRRQRRAHDRRRPIASRHHGAETTTVVDRV